MIRGGFLAPSIREDLIALVRDGKAETRLTRRANALLLLDDGMSCAGQALGHRRPNGSHVHRPSERSERLVVKDEEVVV